MVKHIVLFRLKEDLDIEARSRVADDFKVAIEALPAKIDFIRHIEVGININGDESFDVALYSEFDTLDDVRAYSRHPDHIAASGIIKPYTEARACVDYEF